MALHDGYYLIPKNPDDIVPKRYYSGSLLRWKSEPQDHITALSRIQKIYEASDGYGFGVMIGRGNTLCCYDFDHAISRDGSISSDVSEFLSVLGTFVEISSSGSGLHAFVIVEGETEEYGFDAKICDGKFYPSRFIKLTGNIFQDYDRPIRALTPQEYRTVKNRLGGRPTLPARSNTVPYTGDRDCDWARILLSANIRYEEATEYIGQARKRGNESHLVDWSCRIQCPNIAEHTGYQNRTNQFNPDVAILT